VPGRQKNEYFTFSGIKVKKYGCSGFDFYGVSVSVIQKSVFGYSKIGFGFEISIPTVSFSVLISDSINFHVSYYN